MNVVSVIWRDGSAIWIDGELADVSGDRATVEAALSEPLEVWEHIDRMGTPEGLEVTEPVVIGDGEQTSVLAPGSPEHAATAFLRLPEAILLQGVEFIPAPEVEPEA